MGGLQGHPEITGTDGAFGTKDAKSTSYPSSGGSSAYPRGFTIDAKRSSGVYKDEHHYVQPESVRCFYLIKF